MTISARLCDVADCGGTVRCKGKCESHYRKCIRISRRPSTEQRYETKVDRSGGPDECHPWIRARNKCGYGLFAHDGETLAARWAYKRFVGSLADDEVVRHTCDNRACQNRTHWVKGSQHENVLDAVERNRQHRPMGEANVKARLTADQVRSIRSDQESPRKHLAARYGVSVTTICAIKNRKTWVHVA